jgi:cephalosporin hydroxylase
MGSSGLKPEELQRKFPLKEQENPNLVPLKERTRNSVFDTNIVGRLMVGKYKNTYTNIPFLKDVVSQHLYLELIKKLKPKTVIDLGTAFGGSALWFSKYVPEARVVTFDIKDIRYENSKHQTNIDFYCIDIEDKSAVHNVLKNYPHPWLVCEDCHLHAKNLMDVFDPNMKTGDYIVFEDTHPSNPDKCGMSLESEEYTCESWSLEKLNRVEDEMKTHENYKIDTQIQDFYGYNGCTHINSVFVKT